ncbi:E3 ubiquitin-protein ligase TRIM39 [Microcaecilia unicolor]|uniref:E3 ubiquitin-protein ligase TRIM39-like n=1 Tax=Microcaecilia unicolor TaxID=1415580 RepID=A0A6P7WYY4_9AMPH|nr:E3 ubiquitin-protein ligase TRIM39-like [Microcaecilia unicolor]
MAAASSAENLQEEATCSVCLDYFKDPVIVAACGHDFCRSCITQCWEGLDANFTCPQCRETFQQRVLIPNRKLANVTEITKQLLQKTVRKDSCCEKHNEVLKLFCEHDQKPICVVCGFSQEHKAHAMCLVEEAEQKYKADLEQCLQQLRSKLTDIQTQQSNEEENIVKVKIQEETQRKRITSEFEEMRQFLNVEEQVFLAKLKQEEKEILQTLNANISQLKEQSSSLKEQIAEIEEKCQQPAIEFLNRVIDVLHRGSSMNFPQPEVVHCGLKKTSSGVMCQNIALNNIKKKLKVSEVSLSLDPQTVNPYLFLSGDQKIVSWGNTEQALQMNPKRFDDYPCVLGSEGFTSGKHYWVVQVNKGINWSMGVANMSVSRKLDKRTNQPYFVQTYDGFRTILHESIPIKRAPQKGDMEESPERGIWALEHWKGQYQALSNPVTPLSLIKPQILGMYLDYDGGELSFYNADTEEHIYTFTASFTERIFPYFCVWSGTLKIF